MQGLKHPVRAGASLNQRISSGQFSIAYAPSLLCAGYKRIYNHFSTHVVDQPREVYHKITFLYKSQNRLYIRISSRHGSGSNYIVERKEDVKNCVFVAGGVSLIEREMKWIP